MEILAKGEKAHMKFRTSRRYPGLLKYLIAGVFFIALAAALFMQMIPLQVQLSEMATIGSFLLGGFLIAAEELKRDRMGKYYITNYRVIAARGIVSTKMDAVSYNMIVNVKITQTFWEKVFGLGNLAISTARGHQEIDMIGISSPKKVENAIYSLVEGHSSGQRG